jgi:hypothetical protein
LEYFGRVLQNFLVVLVNLQNKTGVNLSLVTTSFGPSDVRKKLRNMLLQLRVNLVLVGGLFHNLKVRPIFGHSFQQKLKICCFAAETNLKMKFEAWV